MGVGSDSSVELAGVLDARAASSSSVGGTSWWACSLGAGVAVGVSVWGGEDDVLFSDVAGGVCGGVDKAAGSESVDAEGLGSGCFVG